MAFLAGFGDAVDWVLGPLYPVGLGGTDKYLEKIGIWIELLGF